MKKGLLVLSAAMICLFSASFASSSELFNINEAAIYQEMAELTELENHVVATGQTYKELSYTNHTLVANVANINGIASMASFEEPPLGIPSFLWGFCLGVPGLIVVYLVADDKDETTKALWGCVAGSATYVILYFAFWAAIFTSAANSAV